MLRRAIERWRGRTRSSRSSATCRPSGSPSCPSPSGAARGAGATCTTTSSSRCSTISSASRPAAAARAPAPTATGCSASTSIGRTPSSGRSAAGYEGIKPGWVRVNLNYFVPDAVVDYIVEAVEWSPGDGWRLLPDYRFDPSHGALAAPAEPGGAAPAPDRRRLRRRRAHDLPAPPGAGAASPRSAAIWTRREPCSTGPGSPELATGPTPRVSPEFEELLWFELPGACLP